MFLCVQFAYLTLCTASFPSLDVGWGNCDPELYPKATAVVCNVPPVRTKNMSRPMCLIWLIVKHTWMTSGRFNRYCDHLVISSKSWQMEGESEPPKVKQFPFVVTSEVIFFGREFLTEDSPVFFSVWLVLLCTLRWRTCTLSGNSAIAHVTYGPSEQVRFWPVRFHRPCGPSSGAWVD